MFWDAFFSLCEKKGVRPNPLCKELGISSGTVSKWKNESILPNGENLLKISDALGCSVDYLLGRTDRVSLAGPGDAELTEAEKKLLSYFRQLDGRGQDSVFSCAVSQLDRLEELNRGTAILETEERIGDQGNAVL